MKNTKSDIEAIEELVFTRIVEVNKFTLASIYRENNAVQTQLNYKVQSHQMEKMIDRHLHPTQPSVR